MRASLLKALFVAMGAAAASGVATAASYPERPVKMIVSYAPGNATDVLARLVADQLGQRWKQPITVENRPGQGGSIGAQAAAKAPNDGYTLLFSAMAALVINPHVYSSVGYDTLTDFVPITTIAQPYGALVINAAVPATNLDELVAYSKKNPDELNYASAGSGTVPHLNIEALKAHTGLVAQHVPYKGASNATTDLVGGRVHIQQESLAVLKPLISDGKVKALMVSTPQRIPELPDVPSVTEVLPGFQPLSTWFGILAPAGTPPAIVDKIQADVAAVLEDPGLRTALAANAFTIMRSSPDEFGNMLAQDYARLGEQVRRLNVKVD